MCNTRAVHPSVCLCNADGVWRFWNVVNEESATARSVKRLATRWTVWGKEVFLYQKPFRPALGPTQQVTQRFTWR